MHIDPYKILGIGRNATHAEIKEAYRNLSRLNHPDNVGHLSPEFSKLAHEKMVELNQAKEMLLDPLKFYRNYDFRAEERREKQKTDFTSSKRKYRRYNRKAGFGSKYHKKDTGENVRKSFLGIIFNSIFLAVITIVMLSVIIHDHFQQHERGSAGYINQAKISNEDERPLDVLSNYTKAIIKEPGLAFTYIFSEDQSSNDLEDNKVCMLNSGIESYYDPTRSSFGTDWIELFGTLHQRHKAFQLYRSYFD